MDVQDKKRAPISKPRKTIIASKKILPRRTIMKMNAIKNDKQNQNTSNWKRALTKITIMNRLQESFKKRLLSKEELFIQEELREFLTEDMGTKDLDLKETISSLRSSGIMFQGIPEVEFGERSEGWKNVSSHILSPFGNTFREFISRTHNCRRQLQDLENMVEKTNIRKKQMKSVQKQRLALFQHKLSERGNLDMEYTKKEQEALKLFRKLMSIRKHREKIMNSNKVSKSTKEILAKCTVSDPAEDLKLSNMERRQNDNFIAIFQKDIRGTPSKTKKKLIPEHRNLFSLNPIIKKNNNAMKKLSVSFDENFIYENEFTKMIFDEMTSDMSRLQRGKSCYCSGCGGLKYYDKYQCTINNILLPMSKINIEDIKKFGDSPHRSPKASHKLHARSLSTNVKWFNEHKIFGKKMAALSYDVIPSSPSPKRSMPSSPMHYQTPLPLASYRSSKNLLLNVEESPSHKSSSELSSLEDSSEKWDKISDLRDIAQKKSSNNLQIPKQSNRKDSFIGSAMNRFFSKPKSITDTTLSQMSENSKELFKDITYDLKMQLEKNAINQGKIGTTTAPPNLLIMTPPVKSGNSTQQSSTREEKCSSEMKRSDTIAHVIKHRRISNLVLDDKSPSVPFLFKIQRMSTAGTHPFKRMGSISSVYSNTSNKTHRPNIPKTPNSARLPTHKLFRPLDLVSRRKGEMKPPLELSQIIQEEIEPPMSPVKVNKRGHLGENAFSTFGANFDPKHRNRSSTGNLLEYEDNGGTPRISTAQPPFKFYSISTIERPQYLRELRRPATEMKKCKRVLHGSIINKSNKEEKNSLLLSANNPLSPNITNITHECIIRDNISIKREGIKWRCKSKGSRRTNSAFNITSSNNKDDLCSEINRYGIIPTGDIGIGMENIRIIDRTLLTPKLKQMGEVYGTRPSLLKYNISMTSLRNANHTHTQKKYVHLI